MRRSFSLLFNSSARLTYFHDALLLGISCARLFILGRRTTGYYRIHKPKIAVLPGNMSYIRAWCDMQGADGGWILLQQRNDTTVNFSRNWVSFENGFGKPGVGFWVGNKYMHAITLNRRHMLRIELPDIYWGDQSLFGEYDNFQVLGPSTGYALNLGRYRGGLSDILSIVNNSAFSTWDRDNDEVDEECAKTGRGAWWYGKTCYIYDLNSMVGFLTMKIKAREVLEGKSLSFSLFKKVCLRCERVTNDSYLERIASYYYLCSLEPDYSSSRSFGPEETKVNIEMYRLISFRNITFRIGLE